MFAEILPNAPVSSAFHNRIPAELEGTPSDILWACRSSLSCVPNTSKKTRIKAQCHLQRGSPGFLQSPRFRFAEKGHSEGEDVYVVFAQTFGGRYLSVFFIYKPRTKTAVVISARDMSDKERKAYGRK